MTEIKTPQQTVQTTVPQEPAKHEKTCQCTKCKSTNVHVWSRITGYYQNVTGWNRGKLQELKDRKRYGVK